MVAQVRGPNAGIAGGGPPGAPGHRPGRARRSQSIPGMTAAALLPVLVLVGALVLITQGAWPSTLGANLGAIGVIGVATVTLMNKLAGKR